MKRDFRVLPRTSKRCNVATGIRTNDSVRRLRHYHRVLGYCKLVSIATFSVRVLKYCGDGKAVVNSSVTYLVFEPHEVHEVRGVVKFLGTLCFHMYGRVARAAYLPHIDPSSVLCVIYREQSCAMVSKYRLSCVAIFDSEQFTMQFRLMLN